MAEPLLRILNGVKVHTACEGASTHKVHTALHMSLLPACTGITEAVSEAIEGAHAQERLRGLLPVRFQNDGHLHVVIHHRMRHAMHVVEEVTVRLHEGQIVLMAEEVCPAALTVTQGKDGHRKRHGLAAYTQLDLTPVKLALLTRLIVLLDEHILGLPRLLLLAFLDVLADTGVADGEALFHQRKMDVLTLKALLAHTCQTALGILFQPVVNLCTDRLCHACALNLARWILWFTCQAHVCPVFRVRLYLCLILCDVALDCFPAYTYSAGYLPLTQTINAMVMENLFFLVHVYHVLTNYTLQRSYESPYI